MIAQLRTYKIAPGKMESWLRLFKDGVGPNLIKAGLGVKSAWTNQDGNDFIWIRTAPDTSAMESNQRTFWDSPWYKENEDSIGEHIIDIEVKELNPFLPDGI